MRLHLLGKIATAVLVVAITAGFSLPWLGANDACLADDAYITASYVKNLVAGRGLVFDSCERVWGFTSPVHVMVLASIAVTGVSIPWAAVGLDILCMFLCALLALRLGKRLFDRAEYGVVLALLFMGCMPFFRTMGLESNLLFTLQLLFFVLLLEERTMAAALVASFSCLTRPDSLILVVPLMLTHRKFRNIEHIAVFALPGLAWCTFALVYYGDVLPNSYYAKDAFTPFWTYLTTATLYMLGSAPAAVPHASVPIGVAKILLVASLLWHEEIRKRFRLIYALLAYPFLLIVAYAAIGPLVDHSWEVQSAYSFSMAAVCVALVLLGKRIFSRRPRAARFGPWVMGGVALLLVMSALAVHQRRVGAGPTAHWRGLRSDSYREMAHWLDESLPKNAVVFFHEPGTIRFHLDRWDIQVVDWGGINISKRPLLEDGKTVDDRALFMKYGITHVILPTRLQKPTEPHTIGGLRFIQVHSFPHEFRFHTLMKRL